MMSYGGDPSDAPRQNVTGAWDRACRQREPKLNPVARVPFFFIVFQDLTGRECLGTGLA